jgi:predicted metal-dependent phosphoesterase TrpH
LPDARIDLHTHSDCSDGLLSPVELVARAAAREVAILALTDHDTVAGCAAARLACRQPGIRFVAGIELSCSWREHEIHLIGLQVDEHHAGLLQHCAAQLERRRTRLAGIGERLARAGLPGGDLVRSALAAPVPTRTHVARALHAAGWARDVPAAFAHWLARGRAGYLRAQWPGVAETLQVIAAAGGIAVLAHPHRYPLKATHLDELVGEFKTAGGGGLEVSLSGMSLAASDRAATLARRHALAGSIGSDFHQPDLSWRPLGRFAKLPDRIEPITALLGPVESGAAPRQAS